MNHWAVPREFQCDGSGGLTLYRDGRILDPHRLPAAAEFVTGCIVRVSLVDIEVFLIDGENRESPRAALIVPNRYTRERRLASAYHVPTRRFQVHPVPKRRQLNRPVRVVGENGRARKRAVT